jgi:release factor glutamine methyltransferase
MATYRDVLNQAKKLTRLKNKETSATELLMLHFSKLESTELYLNFEEEMPEANEKAFFQGLNLYLEKNMPVQQIIGYVYFYGYKFKVTNQALIPRFETEELVANVLIQYDEYFAPKKVDMIDVGTGSGCLAIALAKEEPRFNVLATDISAEALSLAKENAELIGADIEFIQGDMIKPVMDRKFDILVSNPPYIPTDEDVDDIIINHEPHIALFGGEDGLKFIREIIQDSKHILKEKAIIAFEHAYNKAEAIQALAKEAYPNAKVFTLKDMQQLDRMTFIIIGFNE